MRTTGLFEHVGHRSKSSSVSWKCDQSKLEFEFRCMSSGWSKWSNTSSKGNSLRWLFRRCAQQLGFAIHWNSQGCKGWIFFILDELYFCLALCSFVSFFAVYQAYRALQPRASQWNLYPGHWEWWKVRGQSCLACCSIWLLQECQLTRSIYVRLGNPETFSDHVKRTLVKEQWNAIGFGIAVNVGGTSQKVERGSADEQNVQLLQSLVLLHKWMSVLGTFHCIWLSPSWLVPHPSLCLRWAIAKSANFNVDLASYHSVSSKIKAHGCHGYHYSPRIDAMEVLSQRANKKTPTLQSYETVSCWEAA